MGNVVALNNHVPAMTPAAIDKVRQLETLMAEMPQSPIDTHHVLHAGQYARTIFMPAGMVITGALIKIPTTLIVSGHCSVFIGSDTVELSGYNVITASAGRKQAFVAHSDTHLTMIFATDAETIEDAEEAFTDEADMLLSRTMVGRNTILITGE